MQNPTIRGIEFDMRELFAKWGIECGIFVLGRDGVLHISDALIQAPELPRIALLEQNNPPPTN